MKKHITIKKAPKEVKGTVVAPSDKSISHRAIIFAAMANGHSHLTNVLEGVDTDVTINSISNISNTCYKRKGFGEYYVDSDGLLEIRDHKSVIDVGTSMTSMRFLSGLFAGLGICGTFTSSVERTLDRPIWYISDPLKQMGASFVGRNDGKNAPFTIKGNGLKGISFDSKISSGETKTSLILASLYADQPTTITMPKATRDHTERMLNSMGADIATFDSGRKVIINPLNKALSPINFKVPGEISAAVYWIIFGLLHPNCELLIKDVGLNPSRTGLIDVLKEMGGDITVNIKTDEIETEGDIIVKSSVLRGVDISENVFPRMIDEFPGFALAASLADGKTRIFGANELRNKKSNRINSIVSEFTKLGAKVTETSDGLVFNGVSRLKGGVHLSAHGDHRMANSLFSTAALIGGDSTLEGWELISNTSYPHYFDEVKELFGHEY
jgi:3-phosphoshikimate 1-carboxyvinyltransferase